MQANRLTITNWFKFKMRLKFLKIILPKRDKKNLCSYLFKILNFFHKNKIKFLKNKNFPMKQSFSKYQSKFYKNK